MVTTMCNSGAVVLKAGANATQLTDAQYTQLINQAESFINTHIRIDYTATYSGLTDAKKKIIEDVCSSLAALGAINYDMSGYTSRAEALTMLNVNWDIKEKGLRLLKEKQHTDFINGS